MAAQASLSVAWSKTPKTGFVVTRLKSIAHQNLSVFLTVSVFHSLFQTNLYNFFQAVQASNIDLNKSIEEQVLLSGGWM